MDDIPLNSIYGFHPDIFEFFDYDLITDDKKNPISNNIKKRAKKRIIENKDNKYWIHRMKNNESARKSRQRTYIKRQNYLVKLIKLNTENIQLKLTIQSLQAILCDLKNKILQ